MHYRLLGIKFSNYELLCLPSSVENTANLRGQTEFFGGSPRRRKTLLCWNVTPHSSRTSLVITGQLGLRLWWTYM